MRSHSYNYCYQFNCLHEKIKHSVGWWKSFKTKISAFNSTYVIVPCMYEKTFKELFQWQIIFFSFFENWRIWEIEIWIHASNTRPETWQLLLLRSSKTGCFQHVPRCNGRRHALAWNAAWINDHRYLVLVYRSGTSSSFSLTRRPVYHA